MSKNMKRAAVTVVILMLCMSLPASIADIPAPNDNNGNDYLSVDGFVTTKFASVGSDVVINALTRGHSTTTLVTAEILHFDQDPIDIITSGNPFVGEGTVIDMISLQSTGLHEDDADTMVWEGIYVIPVNALGGAYRARIIAEDGCCLRAVDDSMQLPNVFRGELEKVLEAVAEGWEQYGPAEDIRYEFQSLDDLAENNGGWSTFVSTASKRAGSGESAELWQDMLDAGREQYDMEAGANFLEALMEFFDSEDVDATMAMVTGLMTYLHEFPFPRTFDDFDELGEYLMAVDPIENFTRFEGTTDFEAAYNAMLGSNEWTALETAFDDLINMRKPFEATQVILHNIALLAVSVHPEAIMEGMMTYFEPLMEGDFDSMYPIQKLVVRWIEMAEHLDEESDVVDTNGDDFPDKIIWQYEKLLETPEGQTWSAKMASGDNWVNDVFDNFNSLPEDVMKIGYDAAIDLMEESDILPKMEVFASWMRNATFGSDWVSWPEDSEEEEDDDAWGGDDDSIQFNFDDVSTSKYDKNVLDIGVELGFWGPWEDSDYPNKFTMSMTNNHGETVSTDLNQRDDDRHRYYGRMTATHIEDAIWEFSEPMKNYEPDCASEGCEVSNAELHLENLRPSMMESMSWENTDEMFMVSALGVLVDQDETTLASAPYTVNTLSYDAVGPIQGAEVDIAIIRASPQAAEDAFSALEPEGEIDLTIESPSTFEARYTGGDLDGDLHAYLQNFGDWEDDERARSHPQAIHLDEEGDYEIEGQGSFWDGSDILPYPDRGLVEVITEGTTDGGLGFTFWQQVPLPGSSGCARSEGSGDGGSEVWIGWRYENFRMDSDDEDEYEEGEEFDKPDLKSLNIDWGDGESFHQSMENYYYEDGWESHDYGEDQEDEHWITVTYTDVNDNSVEHNFQYQKDMGFYNEREDYHTGWYDQGYCDLYSSTDVMPSPEIIDSFITDGPAEVMTEQIFTSNSDGEASLSVTPTLPGVYTTLVGSKYTRSDGAVIRGIGMNVVAVTQASVSLGGLHAETSIAGIPVYSVEPSSSGLATISIVPTGLDFSESDTYQAWMGIAPMDLSSLFTDIDEDIWSEPEDYEIEFEEGDDSRSQEVRIHAPISMIAVAIFSEESEMFPVAVHMGVLLNDPGVLEMTGSLGPGQTTNIALAADEGEATRILALAAPRYGFDPASLDLASFSDIFYGEGVRTEVDWIAAERNAVKTCVELSAWYEHDDDYNVRIQVRQEESRYSTDSQYSFDSDDFVLSDSNGNSVSPETDWQSEEGDDWVYADFDLDQGMEEDSGEFYTLSTGSGIGEFKITINYDGGEDEEDGHYYVDMGNDWICSNDRQMDDDDEFAMLDDFLGSLNSVAWGQGTSADLHLPVLSSPKDMYTVITVAQQGEGDSATIMSAIGTQVSVPNPLPPEMQNLTLAFSPPNPVPGDTVVVTVTDEDGQPVEDLSVLVIRDSMTLFSIVSNYDGQTTFTIPTGTLLVRVGGGMYNSVELTIIVTESGVTIEGGGELPSGDGDGGQTDGNNTAEEDCEDGTVFDQLDCEDDDAESSKGTSEPSGGFLPAPSVALTALCLLGASLMRRRSKDD